MKLARRAGSTSVRRASSSGQLVKPASSCKRGISLMKWTGHAVVCCSMDESRVAVSVALAVCCILAVVPLGLWAICHVASLHNLSHCIDMQ